MAPYRSFRAVYKVLDEQEIDVEIYLPTSNTAANHAGYPLIINIHGGAFMLGSSAMVNQDQIGDCLSRGWILLAPNHRLCPQVNLLEGPVQDCRDLLAWVHDGGLQKAVESHTEDPYPVDLDHVFAFGTSSGGTLALTLGFDVPHPVAGIFDMYGPCNFAAPYWTSRIPSILAMLPKDLDEHFLNQIFNEAPAPIVGGMSLEGQRPGAPNFNDPRQAYAFTQIGNGTLLDAIWPSRDWAKVDPVANITPSFPPTFIVHGAEDIMVPVDRSRELYLALSRSGVRCDMRVIPGEGHTFAAKMEVGSRTWNLQREGFDFLESLLR